MKITWVTRSFLDYRIPVYKELDEFCNHQLTLIYNGDVIPQRCLDKVSAVLGERAIPICGETRINWGKSDNTSMANKGFRIRLQRGLVKAIRETNPDVIVSDGFFQWTYAALVVRAMNRKGIKHVMCYERTPHTERNAGKLRTIYRKFVSHWIDVIDCNGSLTAEYVTKSLGFKKPLAFGHMAADTNGITRNVAATTEKDLSELKTKLHLQKLTFIYVGRLIPLKGIVELLQAWKVANLRDATLLLVGDGNQRSEIESFISDNSLSDSVKLAGSVDYDSLGPYYKAADCFIIPTLEDNWSLVVPEAMAAGLPIACSIYNGCYPELVHENNGWIFDPLNLENTVSMLKDIALSKDKLNSMGEESRKIISNFTPKQAAKGIYDACFNLISRDK